VNSGHEQFADDLALYALDALTGEDRVTLEKHLATCAACRLDLEQLRGDGALLALSTMGPKPPLRARQRLIDAVAKESSAVVRAESHPSTIAKGSAPSVFSSPTQPRRSWWGWLGWAATAAVLVLAASLWKENSALRLGLDAANLQIVRNAKTLDDLRRVVAPIVAADSQRFTLVSVKTPAQPQGKAFYLRNHGMLVFVANNMPQLPPQKAYELWLIPMQGAPMPAGMFKPDAHGSATVVNPPLPSGMEAKAFAVTMENEAGAASPTMPIIMMGTGE
jgi:anti-sigma-K factor RskA